MKIEESNRMIAEFMEMKSIYTGGNVDDYEWINTPKGLRWDFDSPPPFHSSWDWLMPVVEKIESKGEYCAIHIDSGSVFVHFSRDMDCEHFTYYKGDGNKIKAVFRGVLCFIEWYNAAGLGLIRLILRI